MDGRRMLPVLHKQSEGRTHRNKVGDAAGIERRQRISEDRVETGGWFAMEQYLSSQRRNQHVQMREHRRYSDSVSDDNPNPTHTMKILANPNPSHGLKILANPNPTQGMKISANPVSSVSKPPIRTRKVRSSRTDMQIKHAAGHGACSTRRTEMEPKWPPPPLRVAGSTVHKNVPREPPAMPMGALHHESRICPHRQREVGGARKGESINGSEKSGATAISGEAGMNPGLTSTNRQLAPHRNIDPVGAAHRSYDRPKFIYNHRDGKTANAPHNIVFLHADQMASSRKTTMKPASDESRIRSRASAAKGRGGRRCTCPSKRRQCFTGESISETESSSIVADTSFSSTGFSRHAEESTAVGRRGTRACHECYRRSRYRRFPPGIPADDSSSAMTESEASSSSGYCRRRQQSRRGVKHSRWEKMKQGGRLRRLINRLAIIFHHHHHHYYHPHPRTRRKTNSTTTNGRRHMFFQKYMGNTRHRDGKACHCQVYQHDDSGKEAVARRKLRHRSGSSLRNKQVDGHLYKKGDHQRGNSSGKKDPGYIHEFLREFISHIWHSRKSQMSSSHRLWGKNVSIRPPTGGPKKSARQWTFRKHAPLIPSDREQGK